MKFSQDAGFSGYTIHSYTDESVTVMGPPADNKPTPTLTTLRQSFIISSDRLISEWQPRSLAELEQSHLEALQELEPEVVIIGVGKQLRFPDPSVLSGLMAQGLGVEVMNTAAACRTYNILAGEGRRVVAAIIISN